MLTRWIATTAAVLSGTLAVGAATQHGGPKGRVLTTAEIAASARQAVVTIETTNADGGDVALGSGFLVSGNGVIVTNWHVMAGAAAATVTMTDGEVFHRVTFLDGDPTTDIAILKIPAANLPRLPMTTDTPPVGSRIVALGSPLGLSDTVSEGIVSAVRVVRGRSLVQTTTPIGPGSSGGPLIDGQGNVFAVSTMMLEGAPLINFGVPIRSAIGYMRDGLPERALPDVFHPAPAHVTVPSGRVGSPAHAPRPVPDLSGTYVLSTFRPREVEASRHQLLVAGKDVGLLRTDQNVASVGVLRTNEKGEVAFAVGDETYTGYQTDQGFAYFAGTGDTMLAVRMPEPLASNIGVYTVTSRVGSGPASDRRVIDSTGEAAVIVDKSHMTISLVLADNEGVSRAFAGNGPVDEHGRFRMAMPGGSLEGTMTAGVIAGEWCATPRDAAATCVPIQAKRR